MKKEVEAILFAAGRTVTQEEVELLLDVKTPGLVKQLVDEITQEYLSRESPLLLISEGEGWKLTVQERFLPIVQKINPHTELSRAVMETLAIIAWQQPILQAKVVDIRSNKAYDHVKELVELGFIAKEKYGRSYLLKLTQKFLDYFDLPNKEAAREVFQEFKDEDLQKKVTQFKAKEGEGLKSDDKLGDLDIYDAGEEKETYKDRDSLKTEGDDPHKEKLGDLEVFAEDESEETDIEEEKDTDSVEVSPETVEESEDTSEELNEANKTKELAERILAEEDEQEITDDKFETNQTESLEKTDVEDKVEE